MSEKFHWTSPSGVEIILPNMDKIPGGLLRKNRKLDPVDMMFSIVEAICDDTMLAKLDELPMSDLNKLFEAWQESSESVGESSGSSI